jgi:hypothetical protein
MEELQELGKEPQEQPEEERQEAEITKLNVQHILCL